MMDFLPPKVSQWKALTARYSSGKLVWAGAAAGAVVVAVLLAFAVQESLLRFWSFADQDQARGPIAKWSGRSRAIGA
jgi:hypothetical protein